MKVSDIRTTLTIIHQTCTELDLANEDNALWTELRKHVKEAESHFTYFEEITKKIVDRRTTQSIEKSKASWKAWFRERKEVHLHAAALRNINRVIGQLLTLFQA